MVWRSFVITLHSIILVFKVYNMSSWLTVAHLFSLFAVELKMWAQHVPIKQLWKDGYIKKQFPLMVNTCFEQTKQVMLTCLQNSPVLI